MFGAGASLLYAVFILLLRRAIPTTRPGARQGGALGAVAQPLYEATLGAAATSLVLVLALGDFQVGRAWPALGWLALLALTSQVIGWLLITVSMPRLPAALVSALLLVQPAGAIALSAAILGELPSAEQLLGVAAILLGVLIAASGGTGRTSADRRAVGSQAAQPGHAVTGPSGPDRGGARACGGVRERAECPRHGSRPGAHEPDYVTGLVA